MRTSVGWCLLAAFLALSPGCATPERVAKRIVTAPNLHQHASSEKWLEPWVKALWGGTNRFQRLTIPVGPPEAKLDALELPAGDYQIDFDSSVERKANGERVFWLKALPRTNGPPAQVTERGTIIVLHGYSVQKETMIPWAFVLAEAGYRVVLLDLRGHGQSTGDTFSCGKYETSDLMQALDYLTAKGWCDGKVGVLGLSFGAELGLYWAARDPRVAAVVAIAPYDQPQEAFQRFAREMKMPVSHKTLQQALDLVATQLDLNWTDWSGEAAVRQLKKPVLLIGGGKDTISPPADLEALKRAAPPGTNSLLVPEANHYIVGYCFHEIAGAVKAWFQARL